MSDHADRAQSKQPQSSVDSAVRGLIETVGALAHEVSIFNERMHGGSALSGISVGINGGPTAVQAWADDLRDAAITARIRAESAIKDLSRIRETLGL